jgi:hypothetical protein
VKCCSLAELSFESGSKMSAIGYGSFAECRSLLAFCIPAQLEVMPPNLFRDCESLTELTFELPSHLKRLELPPSEFGSLCIPNSVEIITGFIRQSGARSCVLQFGEKSQLKEIELSRLRLHWGSVNGPDVGIGIFICYSEMQLRALRPECESS